jgi:galactokinase
LGKKMMLTHKGLSEDYEVSCKELDFLVNAVKDKEQVLGARMMGGGFGGCTINIIKKEAVNSLAIEISASYKKAMRIDLDTIIVQTSGGTEIISQ